MIRDLFKSKKTLEIEKNQKILNNEIKKLSLEILKKDSFIKCKNDFFISRENKEKKAFEWERLEEELRKYNKENLLLKNDCEKIMKILDIDSLNKQYLVKIEKLIPEVRFKKIVKNFKKNGVIYIQCLNRYLIETSIEDEKMKSEVLKRYNKFLIDIMPWDLKTNLLKGDKVTKVYSKHRRLINILNDKSICYIGDLSIKFLEELEEVNFSKSEIDIFKLIYINYQNKYSIKL
ncbi:MAG: hypothetical protein ACRCZR_03965 [Cetobacterium sp.]